MAASERSDPARPRRWLWRWGVGLAGLTLLAFAVSMVVIPLVWPF